jgi:NAD+ synthase (glutamine-hydrolysing)
MRPRCWRGAVLATYCKRELPNYQVFDERRYFASGRDAGWAAGVRGRRRARRPADLRRRLVRRTGAGRPAAGAQVLCVLNASPFHLDKAGEREARMAERARVTGLPLLYATWWAGRTRWCSTARRLRRCAGPGGRARPGLRRRARCRVETADWCRGAAARHPARPRPGQALVTGVRDYLGKNGFPGAIIGLSGGIDSALVLAVAVDALGADRVRT